MADDADPAADDTTGDAGAGAPGAGAAAPTERAKMTREQQDAADRDAFMNGYPDDEEAQAAKAAAPAPAPKKKPAPAPAAKPDADDDDDDDADAGGDDDDADDLDDLDDELDADDDEPADPDADDDDAAPKDPDLAKRFAQVRKREQRSRLQAAARDRAFEQQRQTFIAEWKPKIEKAEAFAKIPKHDVAAILKARGYTEDDFEDVSRMLYGLSTKAAADPKNREAVARMQKERARDDELKELKDWRAQEESRRTQAQQQAAQTEAVDRYIAKVGKAIDDTTPLAKKRLEIAPKSTRVALGRIAYELSKNGEVADPKKVARAFEKKCQRAVERAKLLGEPAATAAAPAGKAKTPASAGGAKPKTPIKVIDQQAATPRKPNGSLLPSREEMIEGLGKLQRGELELD